MQLKSSLISCVCWNKILLLLNVHSTTQSTSDPQVHKISPFYLIPLSPHFIYPLIYINPLQFLLRFILAHKDTIANTLSPICPILQSFSYYLTLSNNNFLIIPDSSAQRLK